MWGPTDYITFLILTPFLLITLSVLIALLLIWLFFKNHARSIQRFVLKNVFSEIFKEEQKADGTGETVFLLKGIDLAADKETLSKTLNGFSLSLVMLAYVVGTMFWQLLLLEVSHSCDENDTTRVCFARIAGKVGPHDSVNCSSPAVQNGTIPVVCYKLVVDFGVATGASYGAFKLFLFAFNVVTSGILMVKTTRVLKEIQWSTMIVLILVSVLMLLIASNVIHVSIDFKSDIWVLSIQIILVVSSTSFLVLYLPWKELIRPNPNENNDGGEQDIAEISPILS